MFQIFFKEAYSEMNIDCFRSLMAWMFGVLLYMMITQYELMWNLIILYFEFRFLYALVEPESEPEPAVPAGSGTGTGGSENPGFLSTLEGAH